MSNVRATLRIEDFARLAAEVCRTATLYAPLHGADGSGPELAPVTPGQAESVVLDCANTVGSIKSVFLPQREVLLSYQGDSLRGEYLPRERIVVFGARPCDARAMADLDRVFGDPQGRFQDPYYLRRRENALVVSLACAAPDATCFCTALGGHPAGREGSDVVAFLLGNDDGSPGGRARQGGAASSSAVFGARLLLEAVTPKGEAFLAEHAGLFREPAAEDGPARDAQVRRAESLLPAAGSAGKLEPRRLQEKLDRSLEHPLWEEVARSCLGCGACAYLCPTCHCFDITDETDGRGCGIRLRSWDCCQYPLFTLHASGHNPRDNRRQRMRQRIMHKFSYTLTNQDARFCVGCGRCVRSCPVNLDIRGILDTLAGL